MLNPCRSYAFYSRLALGAILDLEAKEERHEKSLGDSVSHFGTGIECIQASSSRTLFKVVT